MGTINPKRNVIETIGYGPRVIELAETGMTASAIVADLRIMPDYAQKMATVRRANLFPSDVNLFLVNELKKTRLAVEALSDNQPGNAIALVAAKDHLQEVFQLGATWAEMTQRSMSLLTNALDEFEERQATGAKENPFPFGLWEGVRKSMETSLKTVAALRDDSRLQGIIRAGTVNLNQGMTTGDLMDILFEVGRELGVPEKTMMDAYTQVLVKRSRKKQPIDAGGVAQRPQVTQIIRFKEAELGMPSGHPPPATGGEKGA